MRQIYEMSTNDMVKIIEEELSGKVDCSNAKVGGTAGKTEVIGIKVKETGEEITFPFDYTMNEDDFRVGVKNYFDMRVWTRQHESVLKELNDTGRYIMKTENVSLDMPEYKHIMMEVYMWLANNMPTINIKPEDVSLPIWVVFKSDAAMLPSPNMCLLELEIDENIVYHLNINKWGMILNYSYIPSDEIDDKRHTELLKKYGISDTKAYMSNFYPTLKSEIKNSWMRLFDDNISINDGKECYGLIWEIKKEWVID